MAVASSTRVSSLAHCKREILALCSFLAVSSFLVSQDSRGFQINSDTHNGEPSRRLALVIGNKDYPWKPLANPVNDATDVAAALEQAGFKGNVQKVFNAQHDAMKRAVREFVASVHPGDFAFVYYSGHGVEVKGINYLLPVDLPANASENEVEDDGVSAQRIASELDDHSAAIKVIVLDACRDNPIKASRSGGGGLAPMEGLGSLIVFATEAGRTASDNSASRNGLFTQYLLKALTARGVSLDDAVRDVARQMAADTNRRQVPAIYGLLERPVFLFSAPVTVSVAPSPAAPDPALEAWNAIKESHNPQDFDDFVAAFPQSPYAASAHLAANRLRRESTASSQPSRANPADTQSGTGAAAYPQDPYGTSARLAGDRLRRESTTRAAASSAPSSIAGDWHGWLNVNVKTLRVVMHIAAAPDGALTATLDSPDQSMFGVPVTSAAMMNSKLTLTVDSLPMHPTYEGTVKPDGSGIDGTWTQGQRYTLNFTR